MYCHTVSLSGALPTFVKQLRRAFSAEQQLEIVEAGEDAWHLDALDQEHDYRGLALAKGVEENILEILVFIGHICLLFLAVKPRVRRRFSPTFKTFLPNAICGKAHRRSSAKPKLRLPNSR